MQGFPVPMSLYAFHLSSSHIPSNTDRLAKIYFFIWHILPFFFQFFCIQSIKIVKQKNNKTHIRTGDNCMVEFTFESHHEFIENEIVLFFRDGNTKRCR